MKTFKYLKTASFAVLFSSMAFSTGALASNAAVVEDVVEYIVAGFYLTDTNTGNEYTVIYGITSQDLPNHKDLCWGTLLDEDVESSRFTGQTITNKNGYTIRQLVSEERPLLVWEGFISLAEACEGEPDYEGIIRGQAYDNNLDFDPGRPNAFGFIGVGDGVDQEGNPVKMEASYNFSQIGSNIRVRITPLGN